MGSGSSTQNGAEGQFAYRQGGPFDGKPLANSQTWALCDQGKLFKVVEDSGTSQEKWNLYNDTPDREILVEWAFGPKCKATPMGKAWSAGRTNDGAELVRGMVPPGKTVPFAQGSFAGYKSKWMLVKPGQEIPKEFEQAYPVQQTREEKAPPPPQQQAVTPSDIALAGVTPGTTPALEEEKSAPPPEDKEEEERKRREEEQRQRDAEEQRQREAEEQRQGEAEEQRRLEEEAEQRRLREEDRKRRAREKKAERARLWKELKDRLPSDRSSVSKKERKSLFKQFDTQKAKRLTLDDALTGCVNVLELEQLVDEPKELTMIVTKAFNVARGMSTAETATAEDSQYVEFREFRLFFANTKLYFELWVMFDELDESDDGQVEFKEFKNAVPKLQEFGVDIKDPEAEFKEIDQDNGGVVNFHEFAVWAIAKNLDCDGESEGSDLEARGNLPK